jgi:DNA-binding transcriptional LysR family regulator
MEGEAKIAGVVRIGGFTSFIRTVLIPRLPEWRSQYPQLQIRIVEDDYPALMCQWPLVSAHRRPVNRPTGGP